MFLLDAVEALKTYKVPYAVAGGYAVSLHGAVRGTLDIDFVISLKPKHLASAELAMKDLGLKSRIPITSGELSKFRREFIEKKNLLAWGFVDPRDPTRMIDLMLLDDISKYTIVTKQVSGWPVKILSIASLIKMKKLSGRPQDLEDIKALEKLR